MEKIIKIGVTKINVIRLIIVLSAYFAYVYGYDLGKAFYNALN